MFVAWVTTNLSQRIVGRLVQLPAPVTFILSQLAGNIARRWNLSPGADGARIAATRSLMEIPFLTLAALTRNVNDAGSGNRLNLTINVAGIDVAVAEFVSDHPRSQGYLRRAEAVVSFQLTSLTDSSVRIGTRGDDAWSPEHILLIGQDSRGHVHPIAMETDLTRWLSTDASEGALTIPLRLLAPAQLNTPIRRLLLVVRTADEGDAETDDPVQLQITGSGTIFFSEVITNTPQDDLDRGKSNWYEFPVPAASAFTLSDLRAAQAEATLTMLGDDAWLPGGLFLFGLDTASGRPTQVIPLAEQAVWRDGWLSTDEDEGRRVAHLHI